MKKKTDDISKELEIINEDGQFMVSSLAVAQRFGKQHKDVLEAIRKAISECSPEFSERNFPPSEYSEYTDLTGKTLPAYNLGIWTAEFSAVRTERYSS